MSRKDYIALAAALRDSNASDATIAAIADVLKADNRAFDRDRFNDAATAPIQLRKAA